MGTYSEADTRFKSGSTRINLRILTGILIRHCRLMVHVTKMRITEYSDCQEQEETLSHLLAECNAFWHKRGRTMYKLGIGTPFRTLTVDQHIRELGLERMLLKGM